MADSFFGFDTSLSNLNDDEGGGGPSEDEYDALNDETFGQAEDQDWEVEHENLAHQLESSRRHNSSMDDADSKLEASLSKLVLDDSDSLHKSASAFSSVWRNDAAFPPAPTQSVPLLKNVVSVEELERQLRQNQQPQHQNFPPHHFMQPRYQQPIQPVILQRPPGLQAPAPLPFTQPNMNQMMAQNSQMGQPMNQNQFMNSNQQLGFQNSIGQNNIMNPLQTSQSVHTLGPSTQLMPNQLGQNVNKIGQNMNPMGQNMNQIGQNMNQMGQNMNQMGQNMNQMGQNMNQVMPNGNQFGSNMNQFPHMMGQPRMIAPPPGIVQRQNFSPNMGQFNHNFRGPIPNEQQPNMMLNQQMHQQQMKPQKINQVNSNQPSQVNQMGQVNQMTQIGQMITNQPNQMGHINQIGQSSQLSQANQTMKPQAQVNRVDQKPQKGRTYNNSKMTSQNLVQLIQSTHPMLQYNNSYHNANHHPLLNNRNSSFNNNNFNNQQFNQRHNGTFSNNISSLEDEDSSVSSETDEYAGLMSAREKQWLINIQMLQLNTGTPYIHDFYYTVFLERQANKEKEGVKEAHKANQQNHPFYSGGVSKPEQHQQQHRERHNSARHNSTSEEPPRNYVPAQFENSLGKLQCGSVTAPRKIIDAEVVSEPNTGRISRAGSVASLTPTEVPRETKRTKQLLLDIEALYIILLRLEELNDPLAIANALILKEREEKQKQLEAAQKEAMDIEDEDSNIFLRNIESVQKRPKQDSPKSETIDKRQVVNLAVSQKPPAKNLLDEDRDELVNKMVAGLLYADRLQQMLNVRKGRSLICRFLPRAPLSHGRLRSLWSRVLRSLTSAARRDDNQLPALATPFRKYIQNSSGWSSVLECCSMMTEAFDPARTPYALTSPFTLSCICALIEKATTLVSEPNSNERQWYKFLKTVARAMKNTTLTIPKPVFPISESKLHQHLRQLESRTTIEILQRGRTTVEFADLSKQDVMEYLTKYLC